MKTEARIFPVKPLLDAIQKPKRFASYRELTAAAKRLAGDRRFSVRELGRSEGGRPVHVIQHGHGPLRALIVGFPHPNEPIGGLTVLAMLKWLEDEHPALRNANIEWNIVPCVDPDGAILNEGWSLKPFDLNLYLKNFYRQDGESQIEWSFPIQYKDFSFDRPTAGTRMLLDLFRELKPDFYYPLHNSVYGGAYFYLGGPVAERRSLHSSYGKLVTRLGIPLHGGEPEVPWVSTLGPAVFGELSAKNLYDHLQRLGQPAAARMDGGASSCETLRAIKPEATTLLCELPYVHHPAIASARKTDENRRHLHLLHHANRTYLLSLVLEHWDRNRARLDESNPFFKPVAWWVKHGRADLGSPPQDILKAPAYDRAATEGERFDIGLRLFFTLCWTSQFCRLLRQSGADPSLRRSARRLQEATEDLYRLADQSLKLDRLRPIALKSLAQAQAGSALLTLNEMLRP